MECVLSHSPFEFSSLLQLVRESWFSEHELDCEVVDVVIFLRLHCDVKNAAWLVVLLAREKSKCVGSDLVRLPSELV